ncbi:MAG: hypothetical protein KAZ71_06685 [Bacteroidia bacterium]|nr:hypothetical protein [Bacteroidia bacterium]
MQKTNDTYLANLCLEEDVLIVKMKPNIDIGESELTELFNLSNELADFKKRFVIIDTRENFNSNADIRTLYSDDNFIKYRYADAFIVNSLPMRLLVNFYISFNKPKIPTKMFNNPESAREWIYTLKQEMLKKA